MLRKPAKNNVQNKLFTSGFINSKKPCFIKYQELFFQAQQAFKQGTFQKVVPVVYESFFTKFNVLPLIQTLFKNTHFIPNGFLYGVWNKQSGILGFTPEFLFSLQENRFQTMALAGTGPKTGPSLFKDQKELKEHKFVVQSLQDSLKGIVKWDKKNSI